MGPLTKVYDSISNINFSGLPAVMKEQGSAAANAVKNASMRAWQSFNGLSTGQKLLAAAVVVGGGLLLAGLILGVTKLWNIRIEKNEAAEREAAEREAAEREAAAREAREAAERAQVPAAPALPGPSNIIPLTLQERVAAVRAAREAELMDSQAQQAQQAYGYYMAARR